MLLGPVESPIALGIRLPGTHPTPAFDLPFGHHLRRVRRLGKIILGDKQVALLCDPW